MMIQHFKHLCILTYILLSTLLLAENLQHTSEVASEKKELAIYYTFKGNIEKEYNELVEKKLKKIGFNLTDAHKRVNDQYEVKYGSTALDLLSFMPVVNDRAVLPLLNIDPRIAGFSPFNIAIHKKRDENITHVGHLLPSSMLDILGITNQEVRDKFTATFKTLDKTITQELGGYIATIPYKKLPKKRMMQFVYTFDTPEDIDDFIDEFQNRLELAFIDKGYLIAGFHNFMEATDDAEEILSQYDAFWTYSLCHLNFSYHMFDKEGGRPEASLFAPCTMYIYSQKGSNRLVLGMYRLHNWADALDIIDNTRLKLIEKLDNEIPEILTDFGMQPLPNVNPLTIKNIAPNHKQKKDTVPKQTTKATQKNSAKHTSTSQYINIAGKQLKITLPSVPKAIKCASSYNQHTDRSIKFSKRVPPGYVPHGFDKSHKTKSTANTHIGEVHNAKVSAYLRGEFITVEESQKRLKSAGFEIIASTPLNKDKDLISIVFTDQTLRKMANKKNRGFIASLRLLVDKKEKRISITNPIYMAKGFLQDEFDEKNANKLLIRLVQAFENLKNSKDTLKFQQLPKYQFMKGMPQYQHMIEIASGPDILEKIKKSNNVVFIQNLENGAKLIGVTLSKRTNKFIKRIGRKNAAILPYPILIENNRAKILNPKYYISFMYPLLSMSKFMTIATIPDAMVKDCKRVFK